MPESTSFSGSASRFHAHVFKFGLLCGGLAIVLYLVGLQQVAGVLGWSAALFCGIGVVLAGIASSAES
jgi:hypothetical protein